MMQHQSVSRRFTRVVVVLATLSLVTLAAAPAFAHGDDAKKEKSAAHAKRDKKAKKAKKAKHDMKGMHHDGPAVITGALTGDSPCEKSGPPASVGQTAKDAEGHDARGPLTQTTVTKAEREELIVQQAQARTVATQYPDVATAEAGGYRKSTVYVPCIGAHYTKVSLVAKFDPAAPSELLFDGDTPDAKIVGLSYLLLSPTGAPEGFAGANDIWHQHNANGGLCLNPEAVVVGNEGTSKAECAARGGKKVALENIWMLHNWVVPGWECGWGVFAGECPELGGRIGGTVFDEPDPASFKKALGVKTSKSSTKKKKHAHSSKPGE